MKTNTDSETEFQGECAFSVSLGKRGVAGDRRYSVMRDGKRYVFSNPVAKWLWLLIPGRRAAAQRHWSER